MGDYPVLDRDGLAEAREISNQHWMIGATLSSTFHGRDIFSPAAAHLAAGWEFNLVGPPVQQLVRLSPKTSVMSAKGIEGEIIGVDDPFGSLVTNIPGGDLKGLGYNIGDRVFVQIGKKGSRCLLRDIYGCAGRRVSALCRFTRSGGDRGQPG